VVAGLAVAAAVMMAAIRLAADPQHHLNVVVFVMTAISFVATGGLLVRRLPGNAVSPIVLVFGLLISVYVAVDSWVVLSMPAAAWAALAGSVLDGPVFLLLLVLFLRFPSGRMPGPRWWWLVWVGATLAGVVFVGSATRPGPFLYYAAHANPLGGTVSLLTELWELAYGLLVGCVAIAVISLVSRWRRAGSLERAQLKWAAGAALLIALAMVTYGLGSGPSQFSEVGDLAVGFAMGLFPIAIAISVLRYRLYEIDRIISRTIGWAIVTGLLVAVFAAGVLGLQAALAGVTQGQTLAVAVSTLVAFAVFQPLRHRVQGALDRRFDRARVDAQQVVDAFAGQLRDELDLAALVTGTTRTAAGAVRPAGVGLWLRDRSG
jgi:hypothetical protein